MCNVNAIALQRGSRDSSSPISSAQKFFKFFNFFFFHFFIFLLSRKFYFIAAGIISSIKKWFLVLMCGPICLCYITTAVGGGGGGGVDGNQVLKGSKISNPSTTQ